MSMISQTASVNQSTLQDPKHELSQAVGSIDKNLRIFISGANSLLGHSLFEEFRNDHIAIHTGETPHKFFGTINPLEQETVPIPSSSIKVLNYKTKPRTFKKQLLSCDLFILDLMNCGSFDEVEYVIKALKQNAEDNSNAQSTREQTLIIVSSVMTWINTPKKLKKNFPKKHADDSDIDEEKANRLRDDESETEDDPANPGNKVLYFTDQDFQQRVPSPRFQQIKTIEMMAMSAQKFSKNLRVHIMCAGLPYGNGESNNMFYEFFRKAWLSLHPELASLPIIGSGKNRIPTIHVADLARCLKSLVIHKYKQQYFIAVDQGAKQTQEKIMKSISEGMGSGLIRKVELSDVIDEDWCEFLTLDLKMQTSLVFKDAKFWHCKQGISKQTMGMLNQEFNLYRGLFPLKVFITGPPASGKTHFSQKLSEAYGVPHIKILDLIQMGYKLQDQLGDDIRKKTEEIKDQMVADYDKTKKKKDPELDRNTIKVRLPDEFLYKLLKMQMNTAACKNKGFILDSYPKNANDAKSIFLHQVQDYQHPAEGEENHDLFPGFKIDSDIIPQYTIALHGEDAILKQRVKEMPADKTLDTHYTDQHMDRRLKIYREQNTHDSGHSVQDFFSKAIGKENLLVLNSHDDDTKNFNTLQAFIEKNGKPCCLNLITEKDLKFLKQLEKKKYPQQHHQEEHKHADETHHEQHQEEEEEDEITKIIRREEDEQQKREEEAKERRKIEAAEAEQRKAKEQLDSAKMEQIRQQERDLLDTRSQPIRQYLMDNVVPHLTQGLIDLCKKVPNDPVDYLADFLLKKADEIDQQRIQEREAIIKAKLEAKAAKQK